LKAVLDKNTGIKTMLKILKILNGEEASNEYFLDNFSAEDLAHFGFAPITPMDVERCIFKFKYIY